MRWAPVLALLLTALAAGMPPDPLPAGGLNIPRSERPENIPAFHLSPAGTQAVYGDSAAAEFFLENLVRGERIRFRGFPAAALYASWSPDGRRLGLKQTASGNQAAYLFDTGSGRLVRLTEPARRCGVPSFAADGTIAVSRETEVLLFGPSLRLRRRLELGSYANLVRISPDGRWLAWNDSLDQIWLTDLRTGAAFRISDGKAAYFNPLWRPDSRGLIFQAWDERIFYYDLKAGAAQYLAAGAHPSWSSGGRWLVFARATWSGDGFIADRDIWALRPADGLLQNLTATPDRFEDFPAFRTDDGTLFFRTGDGAVRRRTLRRQNGGWKPVRETALTPPPEVRTVKASPLPKRSGGPELQKSGQNPLEAPYIHQVYDTPNWFNGHWACGATAAVMALSYYQILPDWPTQCNWPTRHISTHGRYICEVYTFNGYTYNIGTPDPNGNLGYGGYGFITRNNWANTKAYMAQYFQQHKLASAVDWSPSWADIKREIGQGFPFVLLNSLTSAGHYILVLGYNDADHSVVVNDPYGDKNQGYMNYSGKGAVYDMPGYSNGHANLNTVWCFVYARALPDLAVQAFSLPDTAEVGDTLHFNVVVGNVGIRPAGEFSVLALLSDDPEIDPGDRVLSRISIAALDSSRQVEIAFRPRLPDSLASGRYAVGVWADASGAIYEKTRRNNRRWRPVVVRGFPRLLQIQPADGAVLPGHNITLLARFADPVCGIDRSSVRCWLDGTELPAGEGTEEDLFFWQGTLASGGHRARLIVKNTAGRALEKEWSFTVGNAAAVAGEESPPWSFRLSPPFPNPSPSTKLAQIRLELRLPRAGRVTFRLFNVLGRSVATASVKFPGAGKRMVTWADLGWETASLAEGLYWLQAVSPWGVQTQKLLVLK